MRCSRCINDRDRPGQRLCKACHAANMRVWRAERRALLRRLVAKVTRETSAREDAR